MLALKKLDSERNRNDAFNYRVTKRDEPTTAFCWKCRNHYRFGNHTSRKIFWCLVLQQPVSEQGQCLAYDNGISYAGGNYPVTTKLQKSTSLKNPPTPPRRDGR